MSNKYVIVTTVSSFTHTYAISVEDLQNQNKDAEMSPDWLSDMVTCQEIEEMSQLYIGENISSTPRIVSEEEMLEIFDRENQYLSKWTKQEKLDFLKHQIKS